jgi:hypothetical protein
VTDTDFDYVDGIVCRAEERKTAAGVCALRSEEKHAMAIWAAVGVIGNGGFQYFFENELSAEESAEAFDSIGMPKTADIFRTALSLFPGGRPQSDWAEALAFIQSREDLFAKLSAQIWDADAEAKSRLASYLRAAGIQ